MSSELQNDQQTSKANVRSGDQTISMPGFEILSVLGTGGMSTVYKARQEGMERLVAIKVLHKYLAQDAVHLQRFRQEARLSTVLDHPNIASLYSFGTIENGQPYLVMEYCVGETLKELMEKTVTFRWSEIHEIFEQILLGMSHAHLHGVIHRDLKPANIFISRDNDGNPQVKIIDFGIAKLEVPDSAAAQKLTKTGIVIGSPHYMSPEQCMSMKVDARTDIYALGCMLYEIVTGQPPFGGESSLEVANKHVSEIATSMSQVSNLRIHTQLEKLVAKAMSKKPEDRFQSVEEFRQALNAISSNSVQGNRKNREKRARLSVKSLLKVAALLAIPILVAAAVLSFSKFIEPRSKQLVKAEDVLNGGNYVRALPMLLELRNTPLSDTDATALVEDLMEVAKMSRSDCGYLQFGGEVPWETAINAATEPSANHPSKFVLCRAHLQSGQMFMGAKLEHEVKYVDHSGLSEKENAFCLGRLAMIMAYDRQATSHFGDAELAYVKALSNFTKAHAIPELENALFEQENLYSDGAHVAENTRSWETSYQYLPELMKCDGRLAADDLMFLTGNYLNPQKKFAESKAAIKRVGEIFDKTRGSHKDMATYYLVLADQIQYESPNNPDNAAMLNWLYRAYNERLAVKVDLQDTVYLLSRIAECQRKMNNPVQALNTLKLAVPLIDKVLNDEQRYGCGVSVYTDMAESFDDLGKVNEALAAREELRPYVRAMSETVLKKLKYTHALQDAVEYHAVTYNWAALVNRLGNSKKAQRIASNEIENIIAAAGMCRPVVDATIGLSQMQTSNSDRIATVEKALQIMTSIAKTRDDFDYALRIKANLGVAYQQTNQLDKALPYLLEVEAALNHPHAVRADWEVFTPFALANAYAQQGKSAQALLIYQKIMPRLKPDQFAEQPVVTQARDLYRKLLGN